MSGNKLEDQSSDKKYFMVTPQLVWAICRSPYDYTLWDVIKMIAGENGECYLSTEDLAILAMMSTGKVSQCRKFLIENGLLKGEIRRDPGYPQPVWHLQIPDIWKENITWRQEFDSLADRIELKKEQKKSLHPVKPSPGEEPPSPDEGGISPGEEPPSPDETKKNQVVELKEKREEEPKKTPSDFGIGKTAPLDGVPQATDGHQRAVDEANGGQAVDPVMEVVKHLRWLCSGRAAKMPKGKELANYTKCAKALLKEKINTDDWQGVCFAIDDWKEHPPQADVWRRDRTKEPHFALDCIAAHYWTLKDKPFHSTHIIERPPPDEVDELYDWWDSQVAYSYRFKGWLKEVIPISRKNGTVTIDISNASDQQRLESLLVTIASGLPDVDRLEIVDQ